MKITAIIENTCLSALNLATESGLSLLIEKDDKKILFDTSLSPKMIQNAHKLNIPLDEMDICIISHGHFDHVGGLEEFMKINKKAKIYMRKGVDEAYFAKFGPIKKFVGVPPQIFENFKNRIEIIDQNLEPLPGVHLITEIKRTRPLGKGNLKLRQLTEKGLVQDDFQHELAMCLTEKPNEGIVITGCSHNGVLNMVDSVKNSLPTINITTVLGGFHMMTIPFLKNNMAGTPQEVRSIAQEFQTYDFKKVYTMHCTGMKAFGILKSVLGEILEYLHGGTCIEI
jgi:7,8-dihydropterin-6-yl-methyl-4-(beta-D-ribofuranosyl)aminobenzene 5'-phosphate synthase